VPATAFVARRRLHRRHVPHHRRTPNHSQGWVIGILSLFLSYLWMMSTSAAKKNHSRYCKDFLKSLDIAERRLQSRKIPRSCLQNPSESIWRKVYEAQNDQRLITLTGFDCASLCLFVRYLHQSSILTHPLFLLGHHASNGRN
jgi:hypothetical protein